MESFKDLENYLKELEHLKELGILPPEEVIKIDEAITEINKTKEILDSETDYKVEINFINKSDNEDPVYAKAGDSGFDLRANESGTLKPMERKLVGTGLYFELPEGYELQIRPRSGLAYKNGITVLNSPGTVDTGYRGEIKVLLVNLSNENFTWEKGERIAQGVFSHRLGTELSQLVKVEEISETERGVGGFGSTGTK